MNLWQYYMIFSFPLVKPTLISKLTYEMHCLHTHYTTIRSFAWHQNDQIFNQEFCLCNFLDPMRSH